MWVKRMHSSVSCSLSFCYDAVVGDASIEVMTNYAQERKAFGKHIGEFGQV